MLLVMEVVVVVVVAVVAELAEEVVVVVGVVALLLVAVAWVEIDAIVGVRRWGLCWGCCLRLRAARVA